MIKRFGDNLFLDIYVESDKELPITIYLGDESMTIKSAKSLLNQLELAILEAERLEDERRI